MQGIGVNQTDCRQNNPDIFGHYLSILKVVMPLATLMIEFYHERKINARFFAKKICNGIQRGRRMEMQGLWTTAGTYPIGRHADQNKFFDCQDIFHLNILRTPHGFFPAGAKD